MVCMWETDECERGNVNKCGGWGERERAREHTRTLLRIEALDAVSRFRAITADGEDLAHADNGAKAVARDVHGDARCPLAPWNRQVQALNAVERVPRDSLPATDHVKCVS